jgi:hypothetical protein
LLGLAQFQLIAAGTKFAMPEALKLARYSNADDIGKKQADRADHVYQHARFLWLG